MMRVGDGLRLCSLDRACGEEVADAVGTAALEQAVAAALRLPSRFPSASVHHRNGVYFQAAKVREREGGKGVLEDAGIVATSARQLYTCVALADVIIQKFIVHFFSRPHFVKFGKFFMHQDYVH